MIKKFQHLLLFTLFVFLFIRSVQAQQSVHHYNFQPATLKIQQAYNEGLISLDEKIRYQFYAVQKPEKLPADYQRSEQVPEKCGTPFRIEYHKKREQLSPATISEVESILNTPSVQAQETYLSSSGKFEIHYDTAGEHAVPAGDENSNGIPDYVEWVAVAADSSWNHEVGTLSYTDFILGPSQPYEVQIKNLSNIYGETESMGNTTLIRIENDFAEGFPSNDHPDGNQIGAINATMAHEVKHAIQYAATRWSGETDDWAEMDATLMEEVVYDDVNDYYNYIRTSESIFSDPKASFYPGSYYHVTWALFFEEKYGPHFWPGVWDIIVANPTITLADALAEALGSEEAFVRDYIESHLWHYASGDNSPPNYGFEERTAYPESSIESGTEFYSDDFSIPRSEPGPQLNELSAHYYEIIPPGGTSGNLTVDITNGEPVTGIGLIAYFQDGNTDVQIYRLGPDQSSIDRTGWNWENIERLGLVLANSNTESSSRPITVAIGKGEFETVTLNQNYPNPFNSETKIRFTLDRATHVRLKVYDTVGRLVRIIYDEELEPGLYEPAFTGGNLAAGVYIYRLITDEEKFVKKMTLIK